MPFKSKAQRGYMFKEHPAIAKRWAKETHDRKSSSNPRVDAAKELLRDIKPKGFNFK